MDLHNEIEARGSSGIGGGLHLQAVFTTSSIQGSRRRGAARDKKPYFVYDPGRGFYARIGSLIALDRPLGFGFNDDKMASLRLTLGGRW